MRTAMLVPLPTDIEASYAAGLDAAGITPQAIDELARHGLFIVPLVHDKTRRDTVGINVYSQALVWYHQAIAQCARHKALLDEIERHPWSAALALSLRRWWWMPTWFTGPR